MIDNLADHESLTNSQEVADAIRLEISDKPTPYDIVAKKVAVDTKKLLLKQYGKYLSQKDDVLVGIENRIIIAKTSDIFDGFQEEYGGG